jgi:hypothetical protein
LESYSLDTLLFNSVCASQGPLVFFCKVKNEVFGGYITNLVEGNSKEDENAFLFSITKGTKL